MTTTPEGPRHLVSEGACDTLFYLDSGAHSLYHAHVDPKTHDYGYFDTREFRDYVDGYADFVKQHRDLIDLYATVDVIYDPARTWKWQKYLEDEHGLDPMPVVHCGTPLEWVERYLESGYEYLGMGGLGQESTKDDYLCWADRVYKYLCPKSHDYLPKIKTHGFAMTSFELMVRYPWWSVDSSSWAKSAAYGSIYVPSRKEGKFLFWRMEDERRVAVEPHIVTTSVAARAPRKGRFAEKESPGRSTFGVHGGRGALDYSKRHITALPLSVRRDLDCWLEEVGVPLGKCSPEGEILEDGVLTHYGCRAVANMKFFEKLSKDLPRWPWPFRSSSRIKQTLWED